VGKESFTPRAVINRYLTVRRQIFTCGYRVDRCQRSGANRQRLSLCCCHFFDRHPESLECQAQRRSLLVLRCAQQHQDWLASGLAGFRRDDPGARGAQPETESLKAGSWRSNIQHAASVQRQAHAEMVGDGKTNRVDAWRLKTSRRIWANAPGAASAGMSGQ
jgi:hypothetical protein